MPVVDGAGIDGILPGYSKAVPNVTSVVMFSVICDSFLEKILRQNFVSFKSVVTRGAGPKLE